MTVRMNVWMETVASFAEVLTILLATQIELQVVTFLAVVPPRRRPKKWM